jgi:hypothetical protein
MNMLKKSLTVIGFAIAVVAIIAAPSFATIQECIEENYPNVHIGSADGYPIKCPAIKFDGDDDYTTIYAKTSRDCASFFEFAADPDFCETSAETPKDEEPVGSSDDGGEDVSTGTSKDDQDIAEEPAHTDDGEEKVAKTNSEKSSSSHNFMPYMIIFIIFAILLTVASIILRVKRLARNIGEVASAVKEHIDQNKQPSEPVQPIDLNQPIDPNQPVDPNQPIDPNQPLNA